jgi:hypothetical protein
VRPALVPCVAMVAAVVAITPRAHADEKSQCVRAFEDAQQLRLDGKLRQARDRLKVCSNERCPAMLRQDCTQWTSEVLAALPTVVLGARDARGRDVASARVLVDGMVVADPLDGRPVVVDPGSHTFRFEAPGAAPVEQLVVVRSGEKNREITVAMALLPAAAATSAPPSAPSSGPSSGDALAAPSRGVSPLAWVFGGVGVAALGTSLALELSVKSDADHLRATCGPSGCSAGQVDPLKTRQTVAGVGLGAGLVSLGVAAYFLVFHRGAAPPPEGRTSLRLDVQPSPGGAFGGVTGTF